ncbi:MAG: glycosyltransferase family 39 protein [Gemmataceae bacterium]|nr:glycosyltransferase family 39 protein [Gemmataceae bacterium]
MQRIVERAVALLLLAAHAAIQARLAWMESDTIDEPGHVASALTYLQRGDFRLYNVNPPLPRLAQGVLLLGAGFDASRSPDPGKHGDRMEFIAGAGFAHANADRWREALFRARLGTLLFSLLGGLLLWRAGDALFGKPCGLAALFLWCADPSVLAHGHLATPDLPAAVVALAAALAHLAYLRDPTASRAAFSAVLLGAALLCKFTLLLLLPLWGVALFFTVRRVPAWHAGLALLLALLVINVGYLFQGTGRRVESFRMLSSKFAWLAPETIDTLHGPANAHGGTWLGALPVPLPAPFIEGMDLQARDFDRYAADRSRFFFAGAWHEGGRWWYYLYGIAVKWPLALFALLLLVRQRPPLLLVLVPLATLALVSSQTGMNKHIRYVLPALPFAVLIAAASAKTAPRWLLVPLLVWAGWSGLRASVDPLAWFNELAGGPRGGIRHLAGSNLDWGQGRWRLRDWLEAHPDFRPVSIAVYGMGTNPLIGLPAGLAPQTPTAGRFAVGVRHLQDDLRSVQDAEGVSHEVKPGGYSWLLRLQPVATAGDSVWIFDVSEEEAERLRREAEE